MEEFLLEQVLQALLRDRMSSVLYETWGIQIRRFVASRLQKPDDDSDVEDGVQETFLGVYRALTNKSDEELIALFPGLEKYLYETAKHVLNKLYRKTARSLQIQQKGQEGSEKTKIFVLSLDLLIDNAISDLIDENAEDPELMIERTEHVEEINVEVSSILAVLPGKYKDILRLRYPEGDDIQPLACIAKQLVKPEGTVKSDLSRATRMARDYIFVRETLKKLGQEGKTVCNSLPSICGKIVLLHFYENMSWDEVAVQCKCTADRAKHHLHRGIELLRHRWNA